MIKMTSEALCVSLDSWYCGDGFTRKQSQRTTAIALVVTVHEHIATSTPFARFTISCTELAAFVTPYSSVTVTTVVTMVPQHDAVR